MTAEMDDPEFELYADFADDWDRFSPEFRKALGEFLEILQKKYYDRDFLRGSQEQEKYWATAFEEHGYKVLWKPRYPNSYSLNQRAKSILIVAIEPL